MFQNIDVSHSIRERILNASVLIEASFSEYLLNAEDISEAETERYCAAAQSLLDLMETVILEPIYKAHPSLRTDRTVLIKHSNRPGDL